MPNFKSTLINKLETYIKENYVDEAAFLAFREAQKHFIHEHKITPKRDFFVDEPFNQKLFKLIDESGLTDVEVYKKAGIDRRHYSKIKSSSKYVPHKKTIFAFILALQLPLEKAELLLESAGYAFSESYLFDLIIKFFITEEFYDINLINEELLKRDLPLIGY